MAYHNDFGKEGEDFVANFLIKNGYIILERNFFYQKAEIDLIAQKANTLAIVEVKARKNIDFESANELIKKSKKKLLIKATDFYVQSNNLEVFVQFDVAILTQKNNLWELNYIENAFDAFG